MWIKLVQVAEKTSLLPTWRCSSPLENAIFGKPSHTNVPNQWFFVKVNSASAAFATYVLHNSLQEAGVP